MRGSDDSAEPRGAAAGAAEEPELYRRLVADHFVRPAGGRYQLEPRWYALMARAARDLHERGELLTDLRVPVAWALVEQYGDSCTDEELSALTMIMSRLEAGAESGKREVARPQR